MAVKKPQKDPFNSNDADGENHRFERTGMVSYSLHQQVRKVIEIHDIG
jgi:hypothetical protein